MERIFNGRMAWEPYQILKNIEDCVELFDETIENNKYIHLEEEKINKKKIQIIKIINHQKKIQKNKKINKEKMEIK